MRSRFLCLLYRRLNMRMLEKNEIIGLIIAGALLCGNLIMYIKHPDQKAPLGSVPKLEKEPKFDWNAELGEMWKIQKDEELIVWDEDF
jgi:hypothetical protein